MEDRASFGFSRNTVSRTASFSLMPCPLLCVRAGLMPGESVTVTLKAGSAAVPPGLAKRVVVEVSVNGGRIRTQATV